MPKSPAGLSLSLCLLSVSFPLSSSLPVEFTLTPFGFFPFFFHDLCKTAALYILELSWPFASTLWSVTVSLTQTQAKSPSSALTAWGSRTVEIANPPPHSFQSIWIGSLSIPPLYTGSIKGIYSALLCKDTNHSCSLHLLNSHYSRETQFETLYSVFTALLNVPSLSFNSTKLISVCTPNQTSLIEYLADVSVCI